MKLAFLGPKGTFTHYATQQAIQTNDWKVDQQIERQSLDQLFDGLINNEFDAIFTPIENSIEGPVNRVLDHLIHTPDIHICDMVRMPINQSILAKVPIQSSDIQHIISMPVAIAQCYSFIKTHCPHATIHHSSSTAAAVGMIDSLQLPHHETVVIGSEAISHHFPIDVIQTNIQDQKTNATQFCLIKKTFDPSLETHKGAHCILSFSTHKDEPGSLLRVLNIFETYGINLTKILSRPEKSEIGAYTFLVEFSIDFDTISLSDVIQRVKEQTLFFKNLGYYRSRDIHD